MFYIKMFIIVYHFKFNNELNATSSINPQLLIFWISLLMILELMRPLCILNSNCRWKSRFGRRVVGVQNEFLKIMVEHINGVIILKLKVNGIKIKWILQPVIMDQLSLSRVLENFMCDVYILINSRVKARIIINCVRVTNIIIICLLGNC